MRQQRPEQPRAERYTQRIPVYYREHDQEKRSLGYTTNLSATGMFLTCHRLVAKGTRLQLEVAERGRSFYLEAEVTRVERVAPELRQVQHQGMGVRFLQVDELIQELLPRVDSDRQEEETPGHEGHFRVRFQDRQQFLEVLEKDIRQGGLFIVTDRPAGLQEVVQVELQPPGTPEPIQFRARVVHRIEPQQDGGTVNLLAGMGVEFVEPREVVRACQAYALRVPGSI
jgi:Tfp pilus assembly protein PilZ